MTRIILLIPFLVACAATQNIPVESRFDDAQIRTMFANMEIAFRNQDPDAVAEFYSSENQDLLNREQSKYNQLLESKQAFAFHLSPTRVEVARNQADVVLFRATVFDRNKRQHREASWRQLKLKKHNDKWKIENEEILQYLNVRNTDLDVTLEPDKGQLKGQAWLELEVMHDGANSVLLDLNRGLQVSSITDSFGNKLKYDHIGNSVVVAWPKTLVARDKLNLDIQYQGGLFNESKERGYSQVNIGKEGSFASWVTHWYPRNAGGVSQSVGKIRFHVPPQLTIACGGQLVSTEKDTKAGHWAFHVAAPIDFSFAAAKYFHRERLLKDVRIGVYFLKGGPAKADLYINEAASLVEYLKDLYGMYPFDAYSMVEIPSSAVGNLGGSSEQGMNLFPDTVLDDYLFNLPLFAHEIGHSWWGNWIKDDNAVISEGLAQMTAVLAVEEFMGDDFMRKFLKWGLPKYPQSAAWFFAGMPTKDTQNLPIGIPNESRHFELHFLADTKGHFVYQMLREKIGDQAFVTGLRGIIQERAHERIALCDLQKAWEHASQQDLKQFFNQWFFRGGAPKLSLDWSVKKENKSYRVDGSITQKRPAYALNLSLFARAGDKVLEHEVSINGVEESFSFAMPFEPNEILLDPDFRVFRWDSAFKNLEPLGKTMMAVLGGQKEQAAHLISDFVKGRSKDAFAHGVAGFLYEFLEQVQHAVDSYQTAVNLLEKGGSPQHWEGALQLHIAGLLNGLGKKRQAQNAYRSVLELDCNGYFKRAAKAALASFEKAEP